MAAAAIVAAGFVSDPQPTRLVLVSSMPWAVWGAPGVFGSSAAGEEGLSLLADTFQGVLGCFCGLW